MSELSDDILRGAKAIGAFLGENERRGFYVCEKRQIPCFKLGSVWCARKSKLLAWIEEQEAA